MSKFSSMDVCTKVAHVPFERWEFNWPKQKITSFTSHQAHQVINESLLYGSPCGHPSCKGSRWFVGGTKWYPNQLLRNSSTENFQYLLPTEQWHIESEKGLWLWGGSLVGGTPLVGNNCLLALSWLSPPLDIFGSKPCDPHIKPCAIHCGGTIHTHEDNGGSGRFPHFLHFPLPKVTHNHPTRL